MFVSKFVNDFQRRVADNIKQDITMKRAASHIIAPGEVASVSNSDFYFDQSPKKYKEEYLALSHSKAQQKAYIEKSQHAQSLSQLLLPTPMEPRRVNDSGTFELDIHIKDIEGSATTKASKGM